LHEFVKAPELFAEVMNDLVEQGQVDPTMVARSGLIRLLIYTLSDGSFVGYKNHFLNGGVGDSDVYTEILGPEGESIKLIQHDLPFRFSKEGADQVVESSNIIQQKLNGVALDLPIKLLDRSSNFLPKNYTYRGGWFDDSSVLLAHKKAISSIKDVIGVDFPSIDVAEFTHSVLVNGSEVVVSAQRICF